MSSLLQTCTTSEQYLEQERKAEFCSEYVNGEVLAKCGSNRNHNLIVVNCLVGLDGRLQDRACEAYANDMRLKAGPLFTLTRMWLSPVTRTLRTANLTFCSIPLLSWKCCRL
jgi:Uma2 family endonuclease